MNEQQIREAILDVIDAGDTVSGIQPSQWLFYHWNEAVANQQRLDFCDAVIAKLENNRIVYGMGPVDNTPAANMIPTDDVLSQQSYRQTDEELRQVS